MGTTQKRTLTTCKDKSQFILKISGKKIVNDFNVIKAEQQWYLASLKEISEILLPF